MVIVFGRALKFDLIVNWSPGCSAVLAIRSCEGAKEIEPSGSPRASSEDAPVGSTAMPFGADWLSAVLMVLDHVIAPVVGSICAAKPSEPVSAPEPGAGAAAICPATETCPPAAVTAVPVVSAPPLK